MSVVIYTGCTPQELRCTRCGAAEPLRWPMGVDALLVLSRKFQHAHRTCAPQGAPDCWGKHPRPAGRYHGLDCHLCTLRDQCRRVTRGEE